jgi:hypothetical protein
MAIYLVRAKPKRKILETLRKELDSGRISKLEPFGEELHYCLEHARIDAKSGGEDWQYALWVEEDYCNPPLAMERENVLDRYFENIMVKPVDTKEDGWHVISNSPSLWK